MNKKKMKTQKKTSPLPKNKNPFYFSFRGRGVSLPRGDDDVAPKENSAGGLSIAELVAKYAPNTLGKELIRVPIGEKERENKERKRLRMVGKMTEEEIASRLLWQRKGRAMKYMSQMGFSQQSGNYITKRIYNKILNTPDKDLSPVYVSLLEDMVIGVEQVADAKKAGRKVLRINESEIQEREIEL